MSVVARGIRGQIITVKLTRETGIIQAAARINSQHATIVSIELQGDDKGAVTLDEAQCISRCRNVIRLYISGCCLSTQFFCAIVTSCNLIEDLDVSAVTFDDDGSVLVALAPYLQRLSILNISCWFDVTNDAILEFSFRCPSLMCIHISHCAKLSKETHVELRRRGVSLSASRWCDLGQRCHPPSRPCASCSKRSLEEGIEAPKEE